MRSNARQQRIPVRHEHWPRDYRWILLCLLWLATFALGYIGFKLYARQADGNSSTGTLIYQTFQLFVLESGQVDVPPAIPWQLQVARFLAPAVIAFTAIQFAVSVFREQLRTVRLYLIRNHTIICGLGRKGSYLVKDFRAKGERVVVIERDEANDDIGMSQELGALVIIGNVSDPMTLDKARVAKAKRLIAICGDDGINVETALHAYHLMAQRRPVWKPPLACYVHIVNLRLCSLFKQHELFTRTDDPFEVKVFNTYESSARLLFRDFPLDRARLTPEDSRTVHLVIVGFGQLGQSVALQAARIAHFPNGQPLQLTIIDRALDEKGWRVFQERCPQLELICDVTVQRQDIEDPDVHKRLRDAADDPNSFMTVAVCLDNDAQSLSCALSLLAYLGGKDCPIMVRMTDEAGLATLFSSRSNRVQSIFQVHAFGQINQSCKSETVLNETLDRLAKAIHNDYLQKRIQEGQSLGSRPALRPWEELDETYKEENRQQADHIPVKLMAIDCFTAPAADNTNEAVRAFSSEEVEMLARMEHSRWNASRLLAGWTLGPKNTENKTTPHLVPWKELSEEIREFDRETVRNIPHWIEMTGERVYRKPTKT